jgi:excisionase family DNA binding protein
MPSETLTETYAIPGKYTVKDAAALLGTSTARVVQLVHSGALKAQRTVGGAFLIDARLLQEYQRIKVGKGRPWRAETAWAALWLLSGIKVDWLGYHQLRRLRIRLGEVSAENLVWFSRKRATTETLRTSSSFLDALRNELTLSGASAGHLLTLGLTERGDVVEGYLDTEELSALKEKYHLVEDAEGNITVHLVLGQPFEMRSIDQMPEAAVLVDLAASADARERSAALKRLRKLLNEQS